MYGSFDQFGYFTNEFPFQVATEVFSRLKSKFLDDGDAGNSDEALEKEINGFKAKLNGHFKYAKIFKDEAELQREQDEKRKQQEEKLQEENQGLMEENNEEGGGGGGPDSMTTLMYDLTIGGDPGSGGGVAVQN